MTDHATRAMSLAPRAIVASRDREMGGDGTAIALDGIFGSEAVRAFQTLLGLTVDGIVGEQTWNRLVNGYLGASDPQIAARAQFV